MFFSFFKFFLFPFFDFFLLFNFTFFSVLDFQEWHGQFYKVAGSGPSEQF